MGSGQRESGLGVIKGRWLPGCGGVADFAGLRESAGHVIRIRGPLEIFEVARHASRAGQVVVVVDVAIGACRGGTVCAPVNGKFKVE